MARALREAEQAASACRLSMPPQHAVIRSRQAESHQYAHHVAHFQSTCDPSLALVCSLKSLTQWIGIELATVV
jgi:hypothetical protein